MTLSLRHGVRCTLTLLGLVATALGSNAWGQDVYPSRNVRVVVPFSAGGGTDVVTRYFAQKLSERMGKNFYVENKAGGGGGSVGSLEVARSKPDGYTIAAGTSSGILNAAMDPNGYNPVTDLQPVARLGTTTLVLVVNAKLPINSVAELVQYAKKNPGTAYGSAGVGSVNHFAGEMLSKAAGVPLTHVPYRGESQATTDVISGQTAMTFSSVGVVQPYVQSGQVRALAVTAPTRFPTLPNVPTLGEVGFKDISIVNSYGFYVPKGTPEAIVNLLVTNINALRADREIASKLVDVASFDTTGSDTPAAFHSAMADELRTYSKLAVDAGLIEVKAK